MRDDERCWSTPPTLSIDQSWLTKGLGLGLGLLCCGFKGVHEEIPPEGASTLQIGSVVFPPGQCISPQLHPCHRLFDQDGHESPTGFELLSQCLFPTMVAIKPRTPSLYPSLYLSLSIYIYIYIYKEKERDRLFVVYIYIYIYTCMYINKMYFHINTS